MMQSLFIHDWLEPYTKEKNMLICNAIDLATEKTHALMITDVILSDDGNVAVMANNTAETIDQRTLEVVQTSIVNIIDKEVTQNLKHIKLGMGLFVDHPNGVAKIIEHNSIKASKEL